jgi:hypothetical protein
VIYKGGHHPAVALHSSSYLSAEFNLPNYRHPQPPFSSNAFQDADPSTRSSPCGHNGTGLRTFFSACLEHSQLIDPSSRVSTTMMNISLRISRLSLQALWMGHIGATAPQAADAARITALRTSTSAHR